MTIRLPYLILCVFYLMIFANVACADPPLKEFGESWEHAADDIQIGGWKGIGERIANPLKDAVRGIRLPDSTVQPFEDIFARNRYEIERIISENPFLVWESLDLALDAIPSLREIRQNGGMLQLSSRLYARAMKLLDQCDALASPAFSKDLHTARSLVDARVTQQMNNQVIIDLN